MEVFPMIRFTILLSFLFTLEAQARVAKGVYKGLDQNGNPCVFEIGDTWFADEYEHPLTERVPVVKLKFSGMKPQYDMWQMGHPSIVDIASVKVGFNHDLFQDVIPTFTGAASVTLFKTDTKPAKPTSLVYMEEHYKNSDLSKKIVCSL